MYALTVDTAGYTAIKSRLLGPLGDTSATISYDLFIPTEQPNPDWFGATQLFVSIPSQNLYNGYVGQAELISLQVGEFNRIRFDVPEDILTKLRSSYVDATFSVVLNVPDGPIRQYKVDNLEVSATIPPNSTIGNAERLTILGFENANGWSISSGSYRWFELRPAHARKLRAGGPAARLCGAEKPSHAEHRTRR
jgi:hypothetical protein